MGGRMVIVGAGECGVRAAFALREFGHDGPVALVGAETHLPYERPPLSKHLAGDGADGKAIAAGERYAEAGIDLIRGVAVASIDRARRLAILADGRALAYYRLLLATGSVPRRLPGVATGGRIVALRTLDDARALRARLAAGGALVIVGGGFIGLEVAAVARRLGLRVTVLESRPRILMRGVPAAIAERLHGLHSAEGVDLRCGSRIEAMDETDAGVAVRLAGGGTLAADLVLAGIGAEPDTTLAARAGLAIDNGIAVDATLATSDPDIFAAGDCCSFPMPHSDGRRVRLECWRNAQEQGALAARNMLGANEAHAAVPWFWSDQYDHCLQIAGIPDMDADGGQETVRRDLPDGGLILFHLDAGGRMVAASGLGPGNSVAKDIRVAGLLIAAATRCDPARLADPGLRLKALLAA